MNAYLVHTQKGKKEEMHIHLALNVFWFPMSSSLGMSGDADSL